MTPPDVIAGRRGPLFLGAVPMLGLLALPVAALVLASSPADVAAGARHPLFGPALWLSAKTTALSLAIIVIAGTPLAWWLAVTPTRWRRIADLVVDIPIVLPPAVVGIALLEALGRAGLLGGTLAAIGVQVPFTTAAVVVAQVVVSAPFYIQSAASAFRSIDPDLLIVARTLGHSPGDTFLRVTLPMALPGLVGGAALSWARAVGEFGATLLFAGNLPGRTQTVPLAIFTALESDVRAALALSLVLAAVAVVLLLALRAFPSVWARAPSPLGGSPGSPRRPHPGVVP